MILTNNQCKYWTETFDPFVGCQPAGESCSSCWAKHEVYRFSQNPVFKGKFSDLVTKQGEQVDWTGKIIFDESVLEKPLKEEEPQIYSVCFRSDFFLAASQKEHWENMKRVLHVIQQAQRHVFIILTKRPQFIAPVLYGSGVLSRGHSFPNVILGTSAGNQFQVRCRVPSLLEIRNLGPWPCLALSIGPCLENIDLQGYLYPWNKLKHKRHDRILDTNNHYLDWIILEGDSKNPDRMLKPDVIRIIRDQCGKNHSTPFLFKQWGLWRPAEDGEIEYDPKKEKKPGMIKTTKKEAGRVFEGRTWDGLPPILQPWQLRIQNIRKRIVDDND